MKRIVIILFCIFSSVCLADSFNNQPINVDGTYTEKNLSRVEKMKVLRQRLEKKNEQLIKKQVEKMRLQSELQLMKKIQKAFEAQLQALN